MKLQFPHSLLLSLSLPRPLSLPLDERDLTFALAFVTVRV
jgi:hypothetical protein